MAIFTKTPPAEALAKGLPNRGLRSRRGRGLSNPLGEHDDLGNSGYDGAYRYQQKHRRKQF